MAYGRLDVFYPDGRIDTFMLEDEAVSVGRAAGNTIPLDTDTVSRYHFSLTYQDHVVSITDLESENGTFIDGMRLPGNQPRVLEGVEEIQVGHLRMVYRPLDDAPTMMVSPIDDDTQRIEREEVQFHIDIDTTHVNVWPASSAAVELSLTNTAAEARVFTVQISGMPENWVRVNRPQLEVEPDETAYVLLNIKPPRRPDVAPQAYQLTVEVAPKEKPAETLPVHIGVRLHAYSGFGIALAPTVIDSREPLHIYLHNQGSMPLTISMQGRSDDDDLLFELPQTPVALAAGQRLRVTGRVRPRGRPLTGTRLDRSFHIQVRAHNDAGFVAAVPGKVRVAPLLPLWGAITAMGLLLSAFALAVLALTGLLSGPPNPQISGITVNTQQIAQGDTLVVEWQADGVDRTTITVNQTLHEQVEGTVTRTEIDTGDLHGSIYVGIEGETRGVVTEDGVAVYVYRPMTLEAFRVAPEQIVRNVVNNLTIEWQVPGAEYVRFEGLEEFTNSALQPRYEASGQLEGVSGIPVDVLNIHLVAQDEVGNVLRETRTIPVIEPVCTAVSDIIVREGPDERYQSVGTVTTGNTVPVNARHIEANWLRLELPGEVQGWAQQELLDCADTFRVEDLQTEMNVPPLPAPTATPTPPDPTAMPTPAPASPIPTAAPTAAATPG